MTKPHSLRCYRYVTVPYEAVRESLRGRALELLRSATASAARRATTLSATLRLESGPFEVGVDVRPYMQGLREEAGVAGLTPVTRVDIAWEAARAPSLFPSMRCTISCWALSATETQLELEGEYRPPLGAVGSALDAVLLHRVADATVHRLLEDIGEELSARSAGEDDPDGA